MGDPLGIVGLDQGFIQKLPFFVSDVGDQQAEKDVQLLNFGGKLRFLNRSAVQQFIHRPIGLAYLHDIDAVFRCRRDLNELAADVYKRQGICAEALQELIIIRGRKLLQVDKCDYTEHPESKKMISCKASAHIPEWQKQQPKEVEEVSPAPIKRCV